MVVTVSSGFAYLLAVFAALFNGSFSSVQKISRVQRISPHPMLLNAYVCIGAAFSCFIIMPFLHFLDAEIKFNILGAFSGCLLVVAVCGSFLAIPRLGLAMASSVWSGCALITSFVWGVAGPSPVGSEPKSWVGSMMALVTLLAGIMGIVFHGQIAQLLCGPKPASLQSDGNPEVFSSLNVTPDRDNREDIESDSANQALLPGSKTGNQKLVGLSLALMVGLAGGSVNVPSTMTAKWGTHLQGAETLPSFGVGALVASVVMGVVYFGFMDRQALASTGPACKELLLPCVISGTMWNLGNICSIYANQGISFAVAQPLLQCALLFAGLLGIFVFKEIKGAANISAFLGSALVLLTGAALLGVYGPSG